MTILQDEAAVVTYIFRSMRKLRGQVRPPDDIGRDPAPTRRLLAQRNLLAASRQYAVVTGSKGKGSTTTLTARLLQNLGYRVGTLTSPHLVTWRERIRVNGQAIPEPDLVRIANVLAPTIDEIETTLNADQYFSPTGLFLAIALQWFDEQGVQVCVLEVGRGGRFDDVALVPNQLAVFSPITLEHTYWLGPTLARIAWHKAGIIKPGGLALSVPQPREVEEALRAEAETQNAILTFVKPGHDLGPISDGRQFRLEPYGDLRLPLLGRYQVMNATLAIRAAATLHAQMGGSVEDFAEHLQTGLTAVRWPGRLQKLQDEPVVYLDGAVTAASAQSVVDSLSATWTRPLVSIIAVPEDKDYAGVYAVLGPVSDALILTETERNPILTFPPAATALALAHAHQPQTTFAPNLAEAVQEARLLAGKDGTILIIGTQSIVADAILDWGYTYETL